MSLTLAGRSGSAKSLNRSACCNLHWCLVNLSLLLLTLNQVLYMYSAERVSCTALSLNYIPNDVRLPSGLVGWLLSKLTYIFSWTYRSKAVPEFKI